MGFLAKVIVSVLVFVICLFLFAIGGAFTPILKSVVAIILVGSLIAIWRSEPPKPDGHQLKKN